MSMSETIISFETAKLAKEKGFNWRNIEILEVKSKSAYLDNTTQSLLQRWLREVHNIDIKPYISHGLLPNATWEYSIQTSKPEYIRSLNKHFNTYEEALELGLQEALKLIK